MGWLPMQVPLRLQIGAVVALFVAALASLWTTGALVMAREGRRASAGDILALAGTALADQGEAVLSSAPRWPYELEPEEWDALDRRLGEVSASALRSFDGVEGGYFLRDHGRFLGASFPTSQPKKKDRDRRGQQGPPPREVDLIEIQADAAIRRKEPFSVVVDVPPSTVVIRTAPVVVDGQAIAATWTMTRLVDPIFIHRSLRGYGLSAGLALGGIVLALLLTLNLARTVTRQKVERDRLQADLRRSERLAALGKLLAGVAHEVRNPLAGIRSTVQLWQRGIGPDAESFEDLLAEVDRLDGIVERLLHFSRAESQEVFPGDVNTLAAEAARLVGPAAEAHRVRVQLDLAPSLPPALMAPPAVLQVLRNLTTNAIQAMPGGGLLRIATSLDSSRDRLEVEVADTGQGLSSEVLDHLFEPFFTTKPSGTGLGLAIAREIALAHHGELRAGPRPGSPGASFTLTLPVAGPDAKPERDLDAGLA
jgi:two-component system, NtrC family, sensor histidine kinase HydH